MDLSNIILAINLASPQLSNYHTQLYATIIERQAKKLDVDPIIMVSIITHESHWDPKLISNDGKDYGLFQIRAHYCNLPPEHLLNPITNIQVGSYFVKANQDYCDRFLNREASTQEWLSCFQGSCRSHKKTCKPTKLANTIEQYAFCLESSIEERVSKDCGKYYQYPI